MTAHTKTYEATINTDSGNDPVIVSPDPIQLARMILRECEAIADAQGFTASNEIFDHVMSIVADERADFDTDSYGKIFVSYLRWNGSDDMRDFFTDFLPESRAAEAWADEQNRWGYSLDQHHADEQSQLMIGVC